MFDALDGTGVDDKDLHLLQNIYWKQKATVKVGNEETDNFDLKIAVRQGCASSPLLYKRPNNAVHRELRRGQRWWDEHKQPKIRR